jgi:5-methylcytosine-specific restriction endonuclease McrA
MSDITCDYCKTSFYRQHYKIKNTNFCTPKCHVLFQRTETDAKNIILLKEGKLSLRGIIKRTMLAMGVEHKCQICGITKWQNKPMSMVLDHIDGKANNNKLDNLRLICHNCDSQSEYYKGRNKGNGRKSLGLL